MKYSLEKTEEVKASDKRWTHVRIEHREDRDDPDRITSVTEEKLHPGWMEAFDNAALETEDGGFDGGPTYNNYWTITPEMAQFALDKMNGNNIRKISPQRIVTMASDVRYEGFCPNGDMLVVFPFFEFVDGQHRLRACVDSGIPMNMRIMFGTCNPDHINTGQSRTFSQVISKDCKYPSLTSGAVNEVISQLHKCLNLPKEEGWKQTGNGNRLLHAVRAMLPGLPDAIEKVKEYDSMYTLGNVARMAGFHTLTTMISPEMANRHIDHIYGRKGWDDVPMEIRMVTRKVNGDKGQTKNNQINRHRVMSGWIQTWNHEFVGHSIPVMDWGNPSILGLASMIYKKGLFPKERLSMFPVVYDMLIVDKHLGGIEKEDVQVCNLIIETSLAGRTITFANMHAGLNTSHSEAKIRRLAQKMADLGVIDMEGTKGRIGGTTFHTTEERVYGWSPFVKPHVNGDMGSVCAPAAEEDQDDVEENA